MHQSFLLSRPRKKIRVFTMEKLNMVGRSENVFILLKILYGDYIMEKKIGSAAKNRDGRMIVNRHTFFLGPILFGLLHLFRSAQLFYLFSESATKIYGQSGNLKHLFLGLIFKNADFLFITLGQH